MKPTETNVCGAVRVPTDRAVPIRRTENIATAMATDASIVDRVRAGVAALIARPEITRNNQSVTSKTSDNKKMNESNIVQVTLYELIGSAWLTFGAELNERPEDAGRLLCFVRCQDPALLDKLAAEFGRLYPNGPVPAFRIEHQKKTDPCLRLPEIISSATRMDNSHDAAGDGTEDHLSKPCVLSLHNFDALSPDERKSYCHLVNGRSRNRGGYQLAQGSVLFCGFYAGPIEMEIRDSGRWYELIAGSSPEDRKWLNMVAEIAKGF
jgi:hypothetical protein